MLNLNRTAVLYSQWVSAYGTIGAAVSQADSHAA
jgi:hypothetical protein